MLSCTPSDRLLVFRMIPCQSQCYTLIAFHSFVLFKFDTCSNPFKCRPPPLSSTYIAPNCSKPNRNTIFSQQSKDKVQYVCHTIDSDNVSSDI